MTTALVQQLRDALRTADALLFTAKPIRQMDLDLLRMSSREAIAAADQWLAGQSAPVKRHCETCAHEPLATSAPPCAVCCAAPYGKFPMWVQAGAAK